MPTDDLGIDMSLEMFEDKDGDGMYEDDLLGGVLDVDDGNGRLGGDNLFGDLFGGRSGNGGDGNGGAQADRIEPNREDMFDRDVGRFRDDDGMFAPGSPPPDLDNEVDRYRAKDGQFKKSSSDLYDEADEVMYDDLSYRG